jgi:hypothetical protein
MAPQGIDGCALEHTIGRGGIAVIGTALEQSRALHGAESAGS